MASLFRLLPRSGASRLLSTAPVFRVARCLSPGTSHFETFQDNTSSSRNVQLAFAAAGFALSGLTIKPALCAEDGEDQRLARVQEDERTRQVAVGDTIWDSSLGSKGEKKGSNFVWSCANCEYTGQVSATRIKGHIMGTDKAYKSRYAYMCGWRYRGREPGVSGFAVIGPYRPNKCDFDDPRYKSWEGNMARCQAELVSQARPMLLWDVARFTRLCKDATFPMECGHPKSVGYVTSDFTARIHMDSLDEPSTYTWTRALHSGPVGAVGGGEWIQASHGAAMRLYDEDVWFFDAGLPHASAEVRPTQGSHRVTYGTFLNSKMLDHCGKKDAQETEQLKKKKKWYNYKKK